MDPKRRAIVATTPGLALAAGQCLAQGRYADPSIAAPAVARPMIEQLVADLPHPALGDQSEVFAPFIGSWELDCVFIAPDGKRTELSGDWHFGWIIGGRAVQDVIWLYPLGARPRNAVDLRGGTTLRLFDPKDRLWHVSYFAVASGIIIHLQGGAADSRVILHGRDVDGSALRWSFNDISADTFRWLGETSADDGKTWRVEQEMKLRRHPAGKR